MVKQVSVFDITIPLSTGWTVDEVKTAFRRECKAWAFNEEAGSESGYPHFQCRVKLKVRSASGAAAKNATGIPGHWSITSSANQDNDFYAVKSETRVSGPYTDKDKVATPIPWQLVGKFESMRPWQRTVYDWRSSRNDRWVELIYDAAGNNGKSTLCNLLEYRGEAYSLMASKNINDMCADLCDELTSNNDYDPKLVFVDMERACNQKDMGPTYAAIERIKGGKVKDRRYKLRKVFFGSPCVVVFTNWLPAPWQLSNDRWRYWCIEDDILRRMTSAEVAAVQASQDASSRAADEASATESS